MARVSFKLPYSEFEHPKDCHYIRKIALHSDNCITPGKTVPKALESVSVSVVFEPTTILTAMVAILILQKLNLPLHL